MITQAARVVVDPKTIRPVWRFTVVGCPTLLCEVYIPCDATIMPQVTPIKERQAWVIRLCSMWI